jgi:hypothetical protein
MTGDQLERRQRAQVMRSFERGAHTIKAPTEWLLFSEAAAKIEVGLKLANEAATMTLYGLCATGNVRWLDDKQQLIEEDECTIAEFSGKPAYVVTVDVLHFLAEGVPNPKQLQAYRDTLILERIHDGDRPGIQLYEFIRGACHVGINRKGQFDQEGFSDKQLGRIAKGFLKQGR